MSLDVSLILPKCNHCNRGDEEVFTANITHNLADMADVIGLYSILWRPDAIGIEFASQLIEPLDNGLSYLKNNPGIAKPYNPENGWGSYENLVEMVEKYLTACKRWPEAKVSVSR